MTPESLKERPVSSFDQGRYVVIDKPLRWTSFDLVNKFRYALCRALGTRRIKVGHAGTLDPLATGVVVICTGKATKMADEIQKGLKHYVATVRFGATTPSFDLESEVDAEYSFEHITESKLTEVLETFLGETEQIPPLFSAINVDGTRAYKLARKGQETELPPRKIFIEDVKVTTFDPPLATIEVTCGKGTYIRALVRDVGRALNSGAHLTALRRTRVGDYGLSEAIRAEEIEDFIARELEKEGYRKEQ